MSKRRQSEAALEDRSSGGSDAVAPNSDKKAKTTSSTPTIPSASNDVNMTDVSSATTNGTDETTATSSATPTPPAIPVDPHAIPISPIQLCTHDLGPHLKVKENEGNLLVVGEKGYRMIRTTHGIQEGAIYFEMKYLPSPPLRISGKMTTPAVRVGVATADGDIQAPVGYDIHSYSYRSTNGTKVHNANVSEYGEGYQVGDVVGVWLVLPHEVKNADALAAAAAQEKEEAEKKIKKKGKKKVGAIDRIAQVLAAEKEKEEQQQVLEQTQADSTTTKLTDAELVQSRKFYKRSFIRFFKNGKPVANGVNAFSDILRAKYFPAVSLYMGATVKLNFGPDFWCIPDQVLGGVQAQLQANAAASASSSTLGGSQPNDSAMSDISHGPSTFSLSPSPPVVAVTGPLPSPPFRLPLSKTLLTSGLFPHVEGSGTTLIMNPKQIQANLNAAEEARQKAMIAAYEIAKKQGLTAVNPTASSATPTNANEPATPTSGGTAGNARATVKS